MKFLDTTNKIEKVYQKGEFNLELWKKYIATIHPKLGQLCLEDMNKAIETGLVSFKEHYQPILNDVIKNKKAKEEVAKNFHLITQNLDREIISKFGKTIDVEIVLYLGLCNGAGWVEVIDNKTYILLGIEKIIELKWYDFKAMKGLIYHELGHAYHNEYTKLNQNFDNNRDKFIWQLFTQGVATFFEQTLIGDFNYYHEDKDSWKEWCDLNLDKIKKDFDKDLSTMSFENQRYFGDWVNYQGKSNVGYYLGTKFIHYLNEKYEFEDILNFDISKVKKEYKEFID